MWWSQDLNPDVLAEKSVHSPLFYTAIQYQKKKRQHYIKCQRRAKKNPCCESDSQSNLHNVTLISTPRLFENQGFKLTSEPPWPGLEFLLKNCLPHYFVGLLNRVGLGCYLSKVQFDQKVFTWKECGRLHYFLVRKNFLS